MNPADLDSRRQELVGGFVLDTSALMTLIEDEAGAGRVDHILRHEHALIPFTAVLEVTYITLQERDEPTADFRYTLLVNSGATVLWHLDEPTLLTAARLKAGYRISLADAIIAAFALRHSAILVHKDPEFEPLAPEVSLEPLPYRAAAPRRAPGPR